MAKESENVRESLTECEMLSLRRGDLCPRCRSILYYKSMPAKSEIELMFDTAAVPKYWYCFRCDKYFK